MRDLLTVILLSFIAVACSLPQEQGSFVSVGSDGWRYGDTVSLVATSADSTDSIARGTLALAVRHTDSYEFSNIWVEVSYLGVDSLQRDTFNVRLADNFGRWLGTGIGVGFQKVDTLSRNFTFNTRIPVSVRHVMRADTLPDIEQIGLIFIP